MRLKIKKHHKIFLPLEKTDEMFNPNIQDRKKIQNKKIFDLKSPLQLIGELTFYATNS